MPSLTWNGTSMGLVSLPYTEQRYRNGTLYTSYDKALSSVAHSTVEMPTVSGYTEDFMKRIKRGDLVPFTELRKKKTVHKMIQASTFTGERFSPLTTPCDLDYRVNSGNSLALSSARVVYQEPDSDRINEALQAAYGKAAEGALQILVEIAEGAKTVALIRDAVGTTMKRTRRVLSETKSKYPKLTKAMDIEAAFAETWLEARYGWNQMVYSSQDVVQAVKSLSDPLSRIAVAKHGITDHYDIALSHLNVTASYWSKPVSERVVATTLTNSRVTRAVCGVRVRTKALKAIDMNLAAFAWEIVPYSFVVDWFLNVGDLLKAHWPVGHIDQFVSAHSVRRTIALEYHVEGCAASTCGNRDDPGDTPLIGRCSLESYDRVPWTGAIPVSLTWRPRLGWEQCVDLIALIPFGKRLAHSFRQTRI